MENYSIKLNSSNSKIIKYICSYAINCGNIKNFISDGFSRSKDTLKMNSDVYELDLKSDYGSYTIEYDFNEKKEQIEITYKQIGDVVSGSDNPLMYEELMLTGSSKELLLDYIEAARKTNITPIKNNKIICRILSQGRWTILSSINKRPKNTLFLPFDIDELLTDINTFFEEEQDYIDNGVPFKMNILLEGVPGSGKTSLIYTVASEINYDISFLNITKDLDDNSIIRAVTSLPDNTILVLEDIDALFIDRESKSNVSFSAILNILDGILKKHKLIIFLTTNHKEHLDPALLRSGRIDKEFSFTYANNSQVTKMFNHFFPDKKEELNKLVSYIKGKKFSTSDLHRFFFEHRKCNNIIEKLEKLESMACKNEYTFENLYI